MASLDGHGRPTPPTGITATRLSRPAIIRQRHGRPHRTGESIAELGPFRVPPLPRTLPDQLRRCVRYRCLLLIQHSERSIRRGAQARRKPGRSASSGCRRQSRRARSGDRGRHGSAITWSMGSGCPPADDRLLFIELGGRRRRPMTYCDADRGGNRLVLVDDVQCPVHAREPRPPRAGRRTSSTAAGDRAGRHRWLFCGAWLCPREVSLMHATSGENATWVRRGGGSPDARIVERADVRRLGGSLPAGREAVAVCCRIARER